MCRTAVIIMENKSAQLMVTRSFLNVQRAEVEHDTGRHVIFIITFSLVYIQLKAKWNIQVIIYTPCGRHVFKVEQPKQTDHCF